MHLLDPAHADDRREPAPPFERQNGHFAIDLPGARALFTTRRGGHSEGPYASLNLGFKTDDDPVRVRANHTTLSHKLGVELRTCRQVHGTEIHHCTRTSTSRTEADGLVTTEADVAPMVTVADCLPIVVAGYGAVVVLHGGWRGLAGGIIAKGVAALRAAGAGGPLTAAIGPGAGGCCYEVGEEVHRVFAQRHPDARRGANLDLKAVAAAELARAGVPEVHDLGMCTLCGDPALFFSHRRDGGVTGRQAGIAWLA